MSITGGEISALLDKADSKMKTAGIDYDNGQYEDAVSRVYYAVFHAMTAILLTKDLTFSSHGQVIGAFNREFIKNGIFPKNFTLIVQSLFEDRQICDYDPVADISEEDSHTHIQNGEMVIKSIREYIEAL